MAAASPPPPKPLYIVVVDGDGRSGSFRYTRAVLQSVLQLMGCKPRHAFKMSKNVFEEMRVEGSGVVEEDFGEIGSPRLFEFELYKRRTTIVASRERFLDVVCAALAAYKYVGPKQRADLLLACRIKERRESVTVFLCGTSGCGKSTLSTLLGSRLGITTVISTDSIRHMMRSYADEKQNPLLWASTYHAGECLDPVAVAKARAKRKQKRHSTSCSSYQDEGVNSCPDLSQEFEQLNDKQIVIEGYKAQSEMVIESLDQLITAWEERKESVIVEGVHLSVSFVMELMKKHPSIIPFMIYISNEDKHMERFAVRAKYMTLDPTKNKYIKYIRNIRTIQEYLCIRAEKYMVPKINNTNVDKSVAAIHATIFSCLRRRAAGEQFCNHKSNAVTVINEEFRNQCAANSVNSSKGMFQLIQRLGSSRRLMAIMNSDGSVHKAWPIDSATSTGHLKNNHKNDIHDPIYGPLSIGKAEDVNLQFGPFGISAWPSDTGCTNKAENVYLDENDNIPSTGTWHASASVSYDQKSDTVIKQMEDEMHSKDDSEEDESDDEYLFESSNEDMYTADEIEGSVDENSTKSDDEFEDLAMRDGMEAVSLSDDISGPTSTNKSCETPVQGNSAATEASKTAECTADSPDSVLSSDIAHRRRKWSRSYSDVRRDSKHSQSRSRPALTKSTSFAKS